jgi:hypothetical protein
MGDAAMIVLAQVGEDLHSCCLPKCRLRAVMDDHCQRHQADACKVLPRGNTAKDSEGKRQASSLGDLAHSCGRVASTLPKKPESGKYDKTGVASSGGVALQQMHGENAD